MVVDADADVQLRKLLRECALESKRVDWERRWMDLQAAQRAKESQRESAGREWWRFGAFMRPGQMRWDMRTDCLLWGNAIEKGRAHTSTGCRWDAAGVQKLVERGCKADWIEVRDVCVTAGIANAPRRRCFPMKLSDSVERRQRTCNWSFQRTVWTHKKISETSLRFV